MQNFFELIGELKQSHPKLVLMIGEVHESDETRKLVRELMGQADIGFHEMPPEVLHPAYNGQLNQRMALKLLEQLRAHPDATKNDVDTMELLAASKESVCMDLAYGKSGNLTLASNAMHRLWNDGVDANDPVFEAVHTITTERAIERIKTSNLPMAHVMDAHLQGYADRERYLAVANVGGAHLVDPYIIAECHGHDMKKTLQDKGYDVVTINIEPTAKKSPRARDGDVEIGQGSNGSDYDVSIVDSRYFERQRAR